MRVDCSAAAEGRFLCSSDLCDALVRQTTRDVPVCQTEEAGLSSNTHGNIHMRQLIARNGHSGRQHACAPGKAMGHAG